MLNGLFDNDINALNDLSIRPKYECVKDYEKINVGDIVTVEIKNSEHHNNIYVAFKRHVYFISELALEKHFKKIEQRK